MCGWFRQVAARGREGGLGPGACLLPSHMQEDVTGLRKGRSVCGTGARCRDRGGRRGIRGPLWGVCNGYMLQRFRLPLA